MSKARFKFIERGGALLAIVLMLLALPCRAAEPNEVILRPDIDITVPRIRIQPPVSEPLLKTYETLPSHMYFNLTAEPSLRLETNPYQAPRGLNSPIDFRKTTDAFRIQTSATLGYALSPKTRVSANYFVLSDHFNDFTRYKLDSTVQSVGVTLEQDLWQKRQWSLKSAVTARELFLPHAQTSGDIVPSLTLIRGIGSYGYGFANASLDLNRDNFVFGNSIERLTPMATLGTGYQFPYGQPKTWQKVLAGTGVNVSGTYTYAKIIHPAEFISDHSQSIILTAEVTRPLWKNLPVQLFVRAEPVFNFGQEIESIGISGINFRLFGGVRVSLNKSPVFTTDLRPKKTTESGKATKEGSS